jgi:molybdopterin-guanine dinucleotide biosynthesis protein A
MNVSAVVLAGGRSSRFGRDKLAEPIAGEPVLARTIVAVLGIATDVVVVTGPDSSLVLPVGIRVVRDRVAYGGPLLAVVTGLAAARHASVVVVGGDMPWLRRDVLTLMLETLIPVYEAAALQFDDRRQQLPLALRREAALHAARRLTDSGERRLGSLLDALSVATIAEDAWRALDPDAATLRDIDTPGDLPPPG